MFEIDNYSNPFHLGIFLDYILRHKIISGELAFNSKLPGIKNLAENHHFSERIAVEAYRRLSKDGFIKTVKKGGTKVSYSIDLKAREMYSKNFVYFQNIINSLFALGFSKDDIFSCFYNAIELCSFSENKIWYLEDNIFDMLQGKEELEKELNLKINCSLIELFEMKNFNLKSSLIVTSYKNYYKLKDLINDCNIIPLRTTPNLSEIINFNKVPSFAKILYITSSFEDRKAVKEKFGYLNKLFKNFKVIEINEFSDEDNIDIIIATNRVFNMLNIRKEKNNFIILKRFYDEDGINLIKSKIEEK